MTTKMEVYKADHLNGCITKVATILRTLYQCAQYKKIKNKTLKLKVSQDLQNKCVDAC